MSFPTRQIPTQISTSHSRNASHSSIKSPRPSASTFDPLIASLTTAQSSYTLANAKSLSEHNDACNDFPGGNTRTVLHASPFPMTFGLWILPLLFISPQSRKGNGRHC